MLQQSSASNPAMSAAASVQSTAAGAAKMMMHQRWDPLDSPDWTNATPSAMLVKRVQRDLQQCFTNPPCGIFVAPDENDVTVVHALVIGPFDTPYEGGYFYFVMRMPPDYPLKPPRVRLMTTGDDTVRFNPNLYRNGKVCLSILGTWHGPSWVASLTLESVLLSIQSLMNENPYHNEPGHEVEHSAGDNQRYNQIVQHETVRVAVCEMLEEKSSSARRCPAQLGEVMQKSFPNFYEHYTTVCKTLIDRGLQGMPMSDPFGEKRGKFDPEGLLKRLHKLNERFGGGMEVD